MNWNKTNLSILYTIVLGVALFFLIGCEAYGQCEERGHVKPNVVFVTDDFCIPYTIDYSDSTVRVYPECNFVQYKCTRCGKQIEETYQKEKRVVIWRKVK
ncbi:MAG: hypothetical protein IPJ03_22475 [Ignavibacteriales bacterium]|nr:hypothetical protein [Ignavibacteriales bacterium]